MIKKFIIKLIFIFLLLFFLKFLEIERIEGLNKIYLHLLF